MGKTLIGARVLSGSEEQEQMQVIAWARLMARKDSALKMLFHIPNGGKRGKLEAIRFKKMGVLAGVPDLFLPAPRKGHYRDEGRWEPDHTAAGRTDPWTEQSGISVQCLLWGGCRNQRNI